jgi:hypothetical protein
VISDNGYRELTAYLLDVVLRNDRMIREIGKPLTRQQGGIEQVGVYIRAIGLETHEAGGDAAMWDLMRGAVALLPTRREEAAVRLVHYWARLDGWLADRDIPKPTKPAKYREPAVARITGSRSA